MHPGPQWPAMSNLRSISAPITITAVAAALSIALLVAWTIILAGGDAPVWLLVLGIISFVVITVVLVLFGFSLAREILQTRLQNQFIDSVTHELKSPLASLKLTVSTLDRPELDDDQRHELRSVMNKDVDRLAVFIDDVLEASRIASTNEAIHLETIVLHEMVVRSVDRVAARHSTGPTGVAIHIDPALTIESDPTPLESILKNLIDNAVKYSDPPAEVSVSAKLDGKDVVVTVSDKGIGIPSADLKRIFARFYRVSSEEVRKRKGTGLGLYIVSAMVRRLGGSLRASSDGVGQGTTVVLRLPRGK